MSATGRNRSGRRGEEAGPHSRAARYFKWQPFTRNQENGGFFVSRLRDDASPHSPSRTCTIRCLTPEELKALLGAIRDKRDRAIFLVAYRHGLRASEMGLLRTNDLDLKGLRLMVHRLKGSHSGEHPLQPDEVRVLKAYLRSRATISPVLFFPSRRHVPISRRTLDWLMKRYGERAGLPQDKSHFHCLKHSIATHMLSAGGDLVFVQDWLGHRNIENTRIYTFLTSTVRDERARTLFMKLPRF